MSSCSQLFKFINKITRNGNINVDGNNTIFIHNILCGLSLLKTSSVKLPIPFYPPFH